MNQVSQFPPPPASLLLRRSDTFAVEKAVLPYRSFDPPLVGFGLTSKGEDLPYPFRIGVEIGLPTLPEPSNGHRLWISDPDPNGILKQWMKLKNRLIFNSKIIICY